MKVLVVEDEALIRLGLVDLVEETGYGAVEACDAAEALRQLDVEPDVSILVTDVDMPGTMDGIGLAWFVRRRLPRARLIVISGKIGVQEAELPPGALFLSKPIRGDALIAAIRGTADLSAT